jgi:hypothetical protein
MRKGVEGILPGDGRTELDIDMLDIPGCIGMKGVVLGERYKEKDAYDILTVVGKCGRGPEDNARMVSPFLREPCMKRGMDIIRTKFKDIGSDGPSWYARFLTLDPEEGKRRMAEAYATMKRFLEALL